MGNYNVLWTVKVLCAVFLFGTVFTTFLCGFADPYQAGISTADTVVTDYVSQGGDRMHYISISITADDTLWGIASKYRTDGSGNITEYVRQIKYCNNMTSDSIYAGSHLVIPVYGL